jgi:hypothetical protein
MGTLDKVDYADHIISTKTVKFYRKNSECVHIRTKKSDVRLHLGVRKLILKHQDNQRVPQVEFANMTNM